MDINAFMGLCKAAKFKEALALAIKDSDGQKYTPSRFSIDKKSNKPIFYKGNKRVELDDSGEWQISKNTKVYE